MQHFWVLKYRNGWRLFSSFKADEMKERDLVYFFLSKESKYKINTRDVQLFNCSLFHP